MLSNFIFYSSDKGTGKIRFSDFSLQLLVVGLLILWAGKSQSTAQVIDANDRKSILLANESDYLRIQALVKEKNWEAAARSAASFVENPPRGFLPVQISKEPSPDADFGLGQVFVRPELLLQNQMSYWDKIAPDALSVYREIVDVEANTLFQAASTGGKRGPLRKIIDRYWLSRVGDDAANLLAEIEFEAGRFSTAAEHWDSLVNDLAFSNSVLRRYPDSDLIRSQLMFNSSMASLFSGNTKTAVKKWNRLKAVFPQATFQWGDQKDLSWEVADSIFDRESKTVASATTFQTRLLPVDLSGKPIWKSPLKPTSKSKSPFFRQSPSIADGDEQTLATFPMVHDQFAYWCNENRILRRRLKPEAAEEVLWQTPFEKDVVPSNRKRLGYPRFNVRVQEGFLFARMGDSLTSYRNETVSRNRSYLMGINLESGGDMLPGFPHEIDDPRVEMESSPVFVDGKYYWLSRKTFGDNSLAQIKVECRHWSPVDQNAPTPSQWSSTVINGNTLNEGIWDEVTQVQLFSSGDRLIFAALGFVVCLDRDSGQVAWMTGYTRDRVRLFQSEIKTAAPRQCVFLFEENGKLIVAPSDTEDVLGLDITNGHVIWKKKLPSVAHVIGVTEKQVIVSGNQLLWLDLESGEILARFPEFNLDGGFGTGLSVTRGWGRGAIHEGLVYWPTYEKIHVFSLDLLQSRRPEWVRSIDLKLRGLSGGNLHVDNGIMLIATEDAIYAFGE